PAKSPVWPARGSQAKRSALRVWLALCVSYQSPINISEKQENHNTVVTCTLMVHELRRLQHLEHCGYIQGSRAPRAPLPRHHPGDFTDLFHVCPDSVRTNWAMDLPLAASLRYDLHHRRLLLSSPHETRSYQ